MVSFEVRSIHTLDEMHLSRAADAASKSFLVTVAALAAMMTKALRSWTAFFLGVAVSVCLSLSLKLSSSQIQTHSGDRNSIR